MKVIVCTVFPIPHVGGASTHIEILCSSLKKREQLATLVHGGQIKFNIFEKLIQLMLRVTNRDYSRVYKLKLTKNKLVGILSDILEKSSENIIIHSHDPLATAAALIASNKKNTIVQTIHGPWSKELLGGNVKLNGSYQQEVLLMENTSFRYSDLLIPVDKGQAVIIENEFNIDNKKIIIIENSIDLNEFDSIKEISINKQYENDYFIVPRRLVPKNGVEFAIRSLSHVKNKKIRLMIAGDGPLRKDLENLTSELNLTNVVTFLGDVKRVELIQLMKNSLGVIVPSVPYNGVVEATSLSVLEAMACNTPVIGSAIGGIKDIIKSKEYGYLVEEGNEMSIAFAINDILSLDTQKRNELTSRAKERVHNNFGSEKWIDKIVSVYQIAIDKKR